MKRLLDVAALVDPSRRCIVRFMEIPSLLVPPRRPHIGKTETGKEKQK